tara:strand:- start:419 stop:2569 length:2151 start_codon:yes stop_codon:yes gene_type:complete
MASIGINGLGRIGKIVFLQLIESNANVVAVNIPEFDIHNIESYLRNDSVHTYDKSWEVNVINDHQFSINNKVINLLNSRDASQLNWKQYGINYVIDATGVYLTYDKAKEHDVDYLIMCSPAKDNTPSFMVNGNHNNYKGEKIVNNVSCTSNALIPVLKVLNDEYGIDNANFITIHSTTSSQQIVDTVKLKNRTGRSLFNNIIPHTTGASKSINKILPELDGKVHGTSVRVPVSNVSYIDLNINLNTDVELDDVLNTLDKYDFIEVNNDKFKTSIDYATTRCPSIIDKHACMTMQKQQFKLSIWYDNEWSYSAKVIELLNHMVQYNTEKNKEYEKKYFIENMDFTGKRVVLRLDWNIPIEGGNIQDYFRIESTLKTLSYIHKQDPAYILIVSHLGRPKCRENKNNFKTYINEINNLLQLNKLPNLNIVEHLESNDFYSQFDSQSDDSKLFLMDNIRFYEFETCTNKTNEYELFKDKYLKLGDVFINDAFACSHRDHLSITGPVKESKEWGYGYLIKKEVDCLTDIIQNVNNKKILAIMGGAKMDDKLPLLDNLSKKIDGIYIAGGNINSILKNEKYTKYINDIKSNKAEIYLMTDGLSSKDISITPKYNTVSNLEEDEYFFDIGMQSIVELAELIDKYDVIFWNGTLGVVENNLYNHGSIALINIMMSKNKKVIIGGGDTACFVNKFDHKFHYVSTGGGASLELLSYSKLIGLSNIL